MILERRVAMNFKIFLEMLKTGRSYDEVYDELYEKDITIVSCSPKSI